MMAYSYNKQHGEYCELQVKVFSLLSFNMSSERECSTTNCKAGVSFCLLALCL